MTDAAEKNDKTPEAVERAIRSIMEQAQVFASTYSLVGGRFDDGSKMSQSYEEKADLEQMIRAAIVPHPPVRPSLSDRR